MPREIGQAEAAGTNGGYGEMLKDVNMIQRTANTRNSAPLTPIAALFAALEAATRATDTANERDDQHAASLFNQRTALVQQIVGTTGTDGVS